jgi:hypothetical protein
LPTIASPDAFRHRLFRLIFWLAAVYNVAFGLWAGFWPLAFFDLFAIERPNYPAIWRCLGMVIGLYGVLYAWAAENLDRGRAVIAVGLAGKILGPIGWIVTVQSGEWPPRLFALIVFNDIIWWLPFSLYLLEGTTAGRIIWSLAPWACAVFNALAAVAMLIWLRGGTEAVPDMNERIAYVAEHPLEWRGGWLLWNAAAISLVAFYAWWGARSPHAGWAIAGFLIGAAGVCVDLACESLYIGWLPRDFETVAPAGSWLMGVVANGLYSVAGVVLTWATPQLRGWYRAWAWAVWASGFALAGAVLAGSVIGTVVATAVMMALFCPWVALAHWKLK